MFNSKLLSNLIKQAQGDISLNSFAYKCKTSPSTLSRIINDKNTCPPAPSTLQKVAIYAHNGITYNDLMMAAGYMNSSETPIEISSISNSTLAQKDKKDIEKKIKALKKELLDDEFVLSGKQMSPEAIEILINTLSVAIKQAKIINKK